MKEERGSRLARRGFLKIFGGAVAGALAPDAVLDLAGRALADPVKRRHKMRMPHFRSRLGAPLAKFVDPLPVPRVFKPGTTANGMARFDVAMTEFKQKLHRDLAPSRLWGYGGSFPGPTFEVRRGKPIQVTFRNELPDQHLFPVDTTIHGADRGTPLVRTVVHVHGLKVLPESDGYPEAWFTKNFEKTGPTYSTKTYTYPQDQAATTLWYHDHALGATRINVYAGLAGLYLVRSDEEDALNLPKGPYEVPLLIQDRLFNADGSLLYPVQEPGDPDPHVPPIWIPEFFGDTVLVNGKVWPVLDVEPRRYRFRIVNGSNARFYNLVLLESGKDGTPNGGPALTFQQIGTDGGFLPAPVAVGNLLMAPAERFDVVVDFAGLDGKSFLMTNDAHAPYPDGDDFVPGEVMLVRVSKKRKGKDTSSLPAALAPVPLLDPASASVTRRLDLIEIDSEMGSPIVALLGGKHWDDPITEDPKIGATEVWEIVNTTEDAHPIHVHLVQFQVLDRRPFNVDKYPGELVYTGPAVAPPANERPAFKDTVRSWPGEVTRIIMKFDPPSGTVVQKGDRLRYVWHCHILEHEDNDMMRPYDLVAP